MKTNKIFEVLFFVVLSLGIIYYIKQYNIFETIIVLIILIVFILSLVALIFLFTKE